MGQAAVIAVSLIAVVAVAYLNLRHAALAALAVMFPLIFVIGFGALSRADPAQYMPYAFLFGVICAQMTGAKIVRCVCAGDAPRDAASRACLAIAGVIGPMLAAYILVALTFVLDSRTGLPPITAILVSAAALGAALAAGWFAQYLTYSEQFITRANRTREWGERRAVFLLWTTQTRWALSVTGIALILGTVAYFGTKGLHIHGAGRPTACMGSAIVALLSVAFYAAVRDWRCTVALILTSMLVVLFAFWALAREAIVLEPLDILPFGTIFLSALTPLLVFAAQTRRAMREGDDHASALAHTLQGESLNVFFSGMALILPALLAGIAMGIVPPLLVIALVSQFCALIAFPALTTAIYTIAPRYRRVDEVFGKH